MRLVTVQVAGQAPLSVLAHQPSIRPAGHRVWPKMLCCSMSPKSMVAYFDRILFLVLIVGMRRKARVRVLLTERHQLGTGTGATPETGRGTGTPLHPAAPTSLALSQGQCLLGNPFPIRALLHHLSDKIEDFPTGAATEPPLPTGAMNGGHLTGVMTGDPPTGAITAACPAGARTGAVIVIGAE